MNGQELGLSRRVAFVELRDAVSVRVRFPIGMLNHMRCCTWQKMARNGSNSGYKASAKPCIMRYLAIQRTDL